MSGRPCPREGQPRGRHAGEAADRETMEELHSRLRSGQDFSVEEFHRPLPELFHLTERLVAEGRLSSAFPFLVFLLAHGVDDETLAVKIAFLATRFFAMVEEYGLAADCLALAGDRGHTKAQQVEGLLLRAELDLGLGHLGDCEVDVERVQVLLAGLDEPDVARFAAQANLLAARAARATRRPDRALAIAEHALAPLSDDVCFEAKMRQEAALSTLDMGHIQDAQSLFQQALTAARRSGHRFCMAEISWRYGEFLGRHGKGLAEPGDNAADLLARALELFRTHGMLRNVERVRSSFRAYGRRDTDRLGQHPVFRRDEDLRVAHEALSKELFAMLHRVIRSLHRGDRLPKTAAQTLAEHVAELNRTLLSVEMSHEGLVSAAGAAVMQHQRLNLLIDGLGRLGREMDRSGTVGGIVELVMQVLDAEGALLALVSRRGALEVYSERNIGTAQWSDLADRARRLGKTAIEGDAAQTGDSVRRPMGTAVALPLKAGDKTHGVLYVKKGRGILSNRDVELLEVLAVQAGMLIDRNKAQWSLHVESQTREATLEAISDGVVTVSTDGRIVQVSSPAARMLGRPREELVGMALLRVIPLKLAKWTPTCLDAWDGTVLSLPRGEVVLTTRIISGESGDVVGTVVTMTELKRAKKAAHRLTGASARYTLRHILSRSRLVAEQVELARSAAASDSSVLIIGESGTGKEVFAQAIHNASARATGPFVGINCAAIPTELLESELFGYEEGAFTGAGRGGRPGKFELAEGGTLLLDEIGDMPLEMQAKLLRVLQERRFVRVGGRRERILDARVMATTNRELDNLVSMGRFREDLLYRIRVIELHLPPLRSRREDIELLAQHFLEHFARRMGKNLSRIAPQVIEFMKAYDWPGNIRELEHVLESEVSLAPPDKQVIDKVPNPLRPNNTLLGIPVARRRKRQSMSLNDAERELLVAAMTEHHGAIQQVAQALGISRGTVYNKLRKYGIDPDRFRKD